jgi:hypothetical protein
MKETNQMKHYRLPSSAGLKKGLMKLIEIIF